MTRPEQREEERRHIEEFLRIERIGARFLGQPDPPDGLLEIGGRRVGVEHRKLTQEELAANRDNLNTFAAMLRTELAALGATLRVSLAFSDGGAKLFRKRREVEEYAKRLAAFAKTCEPTAPRWGAAPGFPEVVSLTLHPSDELRVAVHSVIRAGAGSAVSAAVEDKEAKLPSYRGTVDEAWLLLVTAGDWTQPTELMHVQDVEVRSKFDRVYLLDLGARAVLRLDAENPSPGET